jgi:Leucine-rich repeat (LRR) protein
MIVEKYNSLLLRKKFIYLLLLFFGMKRKWNVLCQITDLPKELIVLIGSFFIKINITKLLRLLNVSKSFHRMVLENWMRFVISYPKANKEWYAKHSKYIVNISDKMIDSVASYPKLNSLRVDSVENDFTDHWLSTTKNKCSHIQELVFTKNICTSSIEKCIPMSNITMLSTYNWFPELFGQFVSLTHLDVSHAPISNLNGIEILQNLVYLDIRSTNVRTVDTIQNLLKLRYLNIANCLVTEIFCLTNCVALEFLCFTEFNINDLVEFINYKSSIRVIPVYMWKISMKPLIPISSIFPIY